MGSERLIRGAQAREAVLALDALSRRFLALGSRAIDDPSLASGLSGVALVHVALEGAFPGRGHAARAERATTRAVDRLGAVSLQPTFFSGYVGVAWVAHLFAEGRADPAAAVDAALERALERSPWTKPYDLVRGLAGIAVYALDRLPRPRAARILALVLDRLAETAIRRQPGLTWRSDPAWAPARYRRTPHPEFDLGVAHGVPGVVAVLGRIAVESPSAATRKRARTLLDGAVAWLLAQELPRRAHGRFAYAAGAGVPRQPARLAWCYGDAGIAAALLVAARAAGEGRWERTALRIARAAAARSEAIENTGVADSGLCHGAAGLAHAFHRLYRATGDERLRDAARTWFARLLAMREPRRGFAGFRAITEPRPGTLAFRGSPDLLLGAGGVALALAAAITGVAPRWDRALLLS